MATNPLLSAVVPIIGARIIDESGIKLLEDVLEKLRKGEALSVALVAERSNGDMIIAFSPGSGDKMKLVGACGLLHRRVEDAIITSKERV